MRFNKYLLVFCLLTGALAACQPAYSQSPRDQITRKCASTTTPAKVGIAVGGTITLAPCAAGTVTVAQPTITAATPALGVTSTWNNGAVTFTGIKLNVGNAAAATDSLFLDLQSSGASKFSIDNLGVVKGYTGTAALPSYSFVADPDTGMWRSGANTINFSTGGTERASISSAGLFTTTGGIASTTGVFSSTITHAGSTSSSPTGGIGYATGAGGAVTQATDKSTGVTSNTITTAVTMNGATLNAATIVAFTFTNSTIAATDTVLCTHQSAGTSAAYTCNAFPGAGSAVVSVRNNTAGNLSEAIVLRITVIKSVSN